MLHYIATFLECSGSNSCISGAVLNHSDPRKEHAFELPEGQSDWHQGWAHLLSRLWAQDQWEAGAGRCHPDIAANNKGIPWQERAHTTKCLLLAAMLCPEWTSHGLRNKMAAFIRMIECNCLSKLVGCAFSYFITAVSSVLCVMVVLCNARKSTELTAKFVLLTVTFTVIQEVFILPRISTLFTIKLLLCYAELHISTFSFFCICTILCGEQCQ